MIWCDGVLRPASEPVLRYDDHGLVVGDGVFETIGTVGGRPFALRRHLERLHRSAGGLHLTVPFDDLTVRAAVDAVLAAARDAGGPAGAERAGGEYRIRVTLTGGPSPLGSRRGPGPASLIVAAAPMGAVADASAVVVVPWTRNERGATSGLKTTSYAENVIALDHAHRLGGDEAIFANTAGDLCEGTGSNVFVVLDDVVLTPPLSSGCLGGVTRSLVLETGLAGEQRLPLDVLHQVSEAFLTSTARWAQPIASVDGRPLAPPGPRTLGIRAALAGLAATTLEP